MAIKSKYKNKQFEQLLNEMITILEKHQAPLDLSLMVLGNTVSHLLLGVEPSKRKVLADTFAQVLLNTVETEQNRSFKH